MNERFDVILNREWENYKIKDLVNLIAKGVEVTEQVQLETDRMLKEKENMTKNLMKMEGPVKRPINQYMLFAKLNRQRFQRFWSSGKKIIGNKEISAHLGKAWNILKETFHDVEELQKEYLMIYSAFKNGFFR